MVPIEEEDVRNTLNVLLRSPNEAGIVAVALKRKKGFKNKHKEEYVSVTRVQNALRLLKRLGHKYYQFEEDPSINDYEGRFEDLNEPENRYLFGDLPDEIENVDESQQADEEPEMVYYRGKMVEVLDEVDIEERETEEYLTKDPVAKYQFEYNRFSFFVDNFPEDDPSLSLSLAPGEGKVPKNILMDEDFDIKAFPNLHPDGKAGLNAQRQRKITYQTYFQQRLFNFNRRFSLTPSYLFMAVMYTETKQLQNNMNIVFKRGRKMQSTSGGTKYSLEDPYSVLDNIKGTPRYFKKKKNEFISKLKNLGGFQFFITLSCADMRWSENFTSLLQLEGHKIHYSTKFDEVLIGEENPVTIEEFLQQHEGKHEYIRKSILNATRNFDARIKKFINTIVMSKFSEMHASYINYRIEFQLRGAGKNYIQFYFIKTISKFLFHFRPLTWSHMG